MVFDQNPKSWGFNFPKGDPQNGFLLINQYVRSHKGLQPLHVPLPWKPLTPILSAMRPDRLRSYEEIVAEHAFPPRSRGRGARYLGSLGWRWWKPFRWEIERITRKETLSGSFCWATFHGCVSHSCRGELLASTCFLPPFEVKPFSEYCFNPCQVISGSFGNCLVEGKAGFYHLRSFAPYPCFMVSSFEKYMPSIQQIGGLFFLGCLNRKRRVLFNHKLLFSFSSNLFQPSVALRSNH